MIGPLHFSELLIQKAYLTQFELSNHMIPGVKLTALEIFQPKLCKLVIKLSKL